MSGWPIHDVVGAVTLHGAGWFPLVAALWVGLGCAIWAIYRPQVRRMGPAARWAMPGLRSLGMMALCLALLRPAFVRPKGPEEYGPVVVLLDVSRSMGVKEQHKSGSALAAMVELAEALGKIPAGLRGGDVPALQGDLEPLAGLIDKAESAQMDLDYARLVDRGEREAQGRQDGIRAELDTTLKTLQARITTMDRSRGMSRSVNDLRGTLSAGSTGHIEWTEVRRRTRDFASQMAAYQQGQDLALYRSNAEVARVCDELAGMSRLQLAQQAISSPGGLEARVGPLVIYTIGEDVRRVGTGDMGKLEATGDASRIDEAVARILQEHRGRPAQAIVLLSDGRDVGGSGRVGDGRTAGSAVPLIALSPAIGETRDVSVSSVRVPPGPFVGETIAVRGEIRQTGLRGTSVDVELAAGDERRTQKLVLRDDLTPYQFDLKLTEAGTRSIEVRVAEIPATAGGEVLAENNRRETTIKVLSRKVRTSLVAGAVTWDFQNVQNALSRSHWARSADAVAGEGIPWTMDEEEILRQDVIVLCDITPGFLTDAQWMAVLELVKDRGGSVILMAGDAGRLADMAKHPVASEFLPWTAEAAKHGAPPRWRIWPGDDAPYRIVPARTSENLEWLKLDERAGGARWSELPPLFSYLELPSPPRLTIEARLVEKQSRSPVLTEERLGAGLVFFVGLNETWRWGLKAGDHDRFWLQLVRHAAEEPFAVGNDAWAMDMDKVVAAVGEGIRVRIKVPPGSSQRLFAQVQSDGRSVEQMELTETSRPGRMESRLEIAEPGEYEVRIVTAGGSPVEGLSMPLRVESSDLAELANIAPDEANLARLARGSGDGLGETLALTRIGRVPEQLQLARRQLGGTTERRLWDSGYLLTFVIACLAAEWALRKREGLA